jgi:hypothetical protein
MTPLRDYRGDFEVHVTASAGDSAARERLRAWCADRGFKCVWIVLARGEHADQPMATWRRRATTLPAVVDEANAHAAELTSIGVPVTRVKVEAAPTNDEIPLRDEDAADHTAGNYFEHHVKLLRAADAPRDALLRACAAFGAHLSRNAFREPAEGLEERFVTLRSYAVGAATSEKKLEGLLAALRDCGERVIEHESEYCVYDSALQLDAGWLAPAD